MIEILLTRCAGMSNLLPLCYEVVTYKCIDPYPQLSLDIHMGRMSASGAIFFSVDSGN